MDLDQDQILQRMLRPEALVVDLMNGWPGILFSQRPDLSFAFISPKVEELTGVPASEWLARSKSFWEVVHETDAEALAARVRAEGETPQGVSSTYRIRHLGTGRISYVWEHRQAVRTAGGKLLGFEGLWLDITRQTIAERRLLNLSWQESLGTLTMGMAHDFCNLMTGIVGLSETFEASSETNPALRDGLGLIRSTALQAGEMAQRIQSLHQGLPGERSYQDLNAVLASLVEVLGKVLPRRIRVQTRLAPGQLALYIDAVELQQVIVNLALNATDAMATGGELTFGTARFEQHPVVRHLQGTLPRPPLICLTVQDTGTGIPEHLLASIFDPFFTTKPPGKGSGLGLYNMRLFAEKHGAAISLETKGGAGTTFHLWFGETDFKEEDRAWPIEPPARQTLLIVGAAGELLDHTVELLRKNDYCVVPVTGEAEAVESLHAPQFQFTAAVVLCTQGQSETLSFCHHLRAYNLPLKILLGVFSCNQDEVAGELLKTVDAVIHFDTSAPDFLSRLRVLLNGA